ncbi:MAG: hypothetical protein H6541_09100 [Lentimicrobiaceae bacterium]|nr:hypothetical protein [Lentimicrobiaceae bacterium]MCO5265221.1 hypothetical protein [Lentimicrobium sp.]HPG32887.1 hypothetical protein [Lentimicrobium sp.]
MENKIAQFFSWVLHPMMMPTYAMLLLFNQNAYFVLILPQKLKLMLAGLIFANTFILPLIFIWMMRKRGIISSLQMPLRSERTFPFAITALFYIATFIMMRNLGLPNLYELFIIGGTVLIIIALIVNLFWKISIHMLGMGGLLGGFIGLSLLSYIDARGLIVSLMALSGAVGFARLKLNTHNSAQVYAGFAAGVIIMLSVLSFL